MSARLVAVVGLGLLAAGCSTWNRNVSGTWDCPAKESLGCVTIGEADGRVGKSQAAPQTGGGSVPATIVDNTAPPPSATSDEQSGSVTLPPFLKKEFWHKLGFGQAAEPSQGEKPAGEGPVAATAPSASPESKAAATPVASAPAAPAPTAAVMPPAPTGNQAGPVQLVQTPPTLPTPARSDTIEVSPAPRPKNVLQVPPTDINGSRVVWAAHVRANEQIGRAWFFPFVDSSGNLHDGGYVYFVVNKSGWNVE